MSRGYRVKARWKPGQHQDFKIPKARQAAISLGYRPNVRLLTVREAAVVLRHSSEWVKKQIRSGRMAYANHGGQYFITTKEVARWMGDSPRGSAPFRRLKAPNCSRKVVAAGPNQHPASSPAAHEPPEVRIEPRIAVPSVRKWGRSIRALVPEVFGHNP